MLENALLGKVFQGSPDAVRMLMEIPTARESVIVSMAESAANRRLPGGYDLSEELARAVALAYRAKKSSPEIYKEGVPVSPFGMQESLFADEQGSTLERNRAVLLLADALNSKRPSDLRGILSVYNKEAQAAAAGQMDVWTGKVPTPEEIIQLVNEHFDKLTPDEKRELVDRSRAESQRTAREAVGAGADGAPQGMDAAERGEGDATQRAEIEALEAQGRTVDNEEAKSLIESLVRGAEKAEEIPLTIQNWDAQFGGDGKVTTPIEDVTMGENQFTKLMREGRNTKFGMVKPTLERPDIVIADTSKAKEGQNTSRPSSHVYVKTFVDETGERIYHFTQSP